MADTSTGVSREKLMIAIGNILTDTNRCIYNWLELNRNNQTFKIDYTEIRGLANNWIARHLRPLVGQTVVHWIFRTGKPILTIDGDTGYVGNITLCSPASGWYQNEQEKIHAQIAELFATVDYKAFYYSAVRKPIDEILWKPMYKDLVPVEENFKEPKEFTSNFHLDLSGISRVKF